ncbi:unnamed protein product [Blepharisma stoltei]|uniref:MIR domain-containing protein n=1 Tax=Blepharisma stoltei TaxID=1481888 RepID=A0AAU9K6E6_9CILI|nr:unnamed protein product [Blepharisma stoltei]
MESPDNSKPIKYGSLITIKIPKSSLLYSHGFIDNDLYLREQSQSDFIGHIFRIIPFSMYGAQNEVLNSLPEISKYPFSEKISRLEDFLDAEVESNLNNYAALKGTPIKFGSLIQLEHYKSQKFLTLKSNENADIEKENFKISLEDYSSEFSIFKIQPCFKFQEEGIGYIKENDKIYLEIAISELNRCAFLHATHSSLASIIDQINGEAGKSFEVNASFEQKSQWIFQEFAYTKNEEIDYMKLGDCVWIKPSEEKVRLGAFGKESKVYFNDNCNDTNGLWIIENENCATGGVLNSNMNIRIKHLSTGCYLSIGKSRNSKDKLILEKELKKKTVWKLVKIKDEQNIINDDYCRILNVKKNVYINSKKRTKSGLDYTPSLTDENDEFTCFRIFNADSERVKETQFLLNAYPIISYYPQFLLQNESSEYQNFDLYTHLLLICLKNLTKFCRNSLYFMVGVDQRIGQTQFKRQKLLKEHNFIDSLCEILKFSITTDKEKKMIKQLKKEKSLKTDNFYIKRARKVIDWETFKIKTIFRVVKKIYKLLSAICKANSEIQTYLFQFLNVFANHIGLDSWVKNCLLEILSNNEELLLKIHEAKIEENSENIIEFHVNLLKNTKKEFKHHIIDFLKFICVYNGNSVHVNQEVLYEYLFINKENYRRLMIPVFINAANDLCIEIDSSGSIVSLEECFEDFEKYEKKLIYFRHIIKLLANMSSGRNFLCIEKLKDLFPPDALFKAIWNSNISNDLKASLSKLMLALYIDTPPREDIIKPELIKVLAFDENFQENDIFDNKHLRINSCSSEQSTSRSSKKVANAFMIEEEEEIAISNDEEIIIYNFMKKILEYLSCTDIGAADKFTYEILKIGEKLIKFEMFGTGYTCYDNGVYLYSPLSKEFTIENMDIVKFAKSIIPLFLKNQNINILNRKYSINPGRKINKIYKFQESTQYENSSICALNIKNLLVSFPSNFSKINHSSSARSKILMSSILNKYLDTRQEFLLNNILHWFQNLKEQTLWKIDEITSLLPPVLMIGEKMSRYLSKEIIQEIYSHNFKTWCPVIVPDLNFLYHKPILSALLKGFVYSTDYSLQSVFLSFILRCFSQRTELLKSVKHLYALSSKTDVELISWLKSHISIFKKFCDQSELWLNTWTGDHLNHQNTIDRVIELLGDFELIFYEGVCIDNGKPSYMGLSNISPIRQEMLSYLCLHDHIIKLIKDGMHTLETLYMQENSQYDKIKKQTKELFSRCHRILKRLVYENPKNQKIMHSHVHIFMQYLKINVEQIPLICEIYKNNLNLIKTLSLDILKSFVNLIYLEGRQPAFLDFFDIILSVQGNYKILNRAENSRIYIPEIQRLVLNVFEDKTIDRFLLFMNNEGEFIFTEKPQEKKIGKYKDIPYEYHAKLISLLSKCGVGVNGMYMNEAKCQKIISLENVFKILKQIEESPFSQLEKLKIPMIEFLYNNYLDCEKKSEEMKNNCYFVSYIAMQNEIMQEKYLFDTKYLIFLKIFIDCVDKYCELYINSRNSTPDNSDIAEIEKFAYTLSQCSNKFCRIRIPNDFYEKICNFCKKFDYEFPEISYDDDAEDYLQNTCNIALQTNISFEEKASITPIGEYWEKVRNFLVYDSEIKDLIDIEQRALKIAIINSRDMLSSKLSLSIILRALVEFINQSTFHRTDMKLITKSIELLNLLLEEFVLNKSDEDNIVNTRNELWKMKIGKLSISMMCIPDLDCQTFLTSVELSLLLLQTNANLIQQEISEFLLQSDVSMLFYNRIHKIINKSIEEHSSLENEKETASPVYKKRYDPIRIILKLLRELCRRDLGFKEYIKHQKNAQKSYDIVDDIISLLETLVKNMNKGSLNAICECLDTISSFVSGCKANQDTIINGRLLEIIARLMELNESRDKFENYHAPNEKQINGNLMDSWMISKIKYKSMQTIINLIEGRKDDHFISKIVRILNFEVVEENLVNVYSNFVDYYPNADYNPEIFNHLYTYDHKSLSNPQDTNPKYYTCIIETGFYIYQLLKYYEEVILMKTIKYNTKATTKSYFKEKYAISSIWKLPLIPYFMMMQKQKPKVTVEIDREKLMENAYAFFQKHTCNVEVLLENNNLIKIYFIMPPEYQGLSKEIKKIFQRDVDRTSNHTKLQFLINKTDEIIAKIKHEQALKQLFSKYYLFSLLFYNVLLWEDIVFHLNLIENFGIIYSFSYYDTDPIDEPSLFYEANGNSWGLDIDQTWVFLKTIGILEALSSFIVLCHYLAKESPLIFKQIAKDYSWTSSRQNNLSKFFLSCQLIAISSWKILTYPIILYYIIFLAFAILGASIHPFFFSINLLMNMVYRYPTMQLICMSIRIPFKAMVSAWILMFLIVYIFGVVGYSLIHNDFTDYCPSILVCSIYIFDQGWKQNGGIGVSLKNYAPGELDYIRLLYDNLYNVIIVVTMLNVVQGIVMDVFAQIREKNNNDITDMKTKCFMCGLERDYIERVTNEPFKHHICFEHCEWNYILYIAHILNKNKEEYTSAEKYIKELYELKDIRWYPWNQSLSIN